MTGLSNYILQCWLLQWPLPAVKLHTTFMSTTHYGVESQLTQVSKVVRLCIFFQGSSWSHFNEIISALRHGRFCLQNSAGSLFPLSPQQIKLLCNSALSEFIWQFTCTHEIPLHLGILWFMELIAIYGLRFILHVITTLHNITYWKYSWEPCENKFMTYLDLKVKCNLNT